MSSEDVTDIENSPTTFVGAVESDQTLTVQVFIFGDVNFFADGVDEGLVRLGRQEMTNSSSDAAKEPLGYRCNRVGTLDQHRIRPDRGS